MWNKYEIIPLSTKMRQKVKQYGKIWEVLAQETGILDKMWHLRTLNAVHAGGHPYEIWSEVGKDFNFGEKK